MTQYDVPSQHLSTVLNLQVPNMKSEKAELGNGTNLPSHHTVPPEDTISFADEKIVPEGDQRKKHREIEAACHARDIPLLRAFADLKGGFLTDQTRRLACQSHRNL